jgi:D-alanyl-D-alanine carboxypeptidase/D-alanyl-D-alanine-endopeptidase (penicillin-binding protein 4)
LPGLCSIERLKARGVRVEKGVDSTPAADMLPEEEAYNRLPIIARHTSARFAESLRVILKVSHNNHAHMLPMLIGSKIEREATSAACAPEGDVLRNLGLDTGSFSLGDGEGGDQGDQISPRATIQLLRLMAGRPDAGVFRDALPILGVDGTLAEAVPATSPARGRVQAKTGTYVVADPLNSRLLLRAKGLGGYVTAASGRRLIIAIFLNNVPMRSPAETNRHGATLGRLAELIQQSL